MKSVRSLIGRPVLLEGKTIGRVAQFELDESLHHLTGLYVNGGLFGTRRIPAEQIRVLGSVCVLVEGNGKREHAKEEAVRRRARLSDGTRIGAVTGAVLDEKTLHVKALELSRGYVDDLFHPRQWIAHYAVHQLSGDVLVEPEGGKAE